MRVLSRVGKIRVVGLLTVAWMVGVACSDDEKVNPVVTDAGLVADTAVALDSSEPLTDSGATDSGSADAGNVGTGTGGPYQLLYSGLLNGIDTRLVTATIDGTGGMLSYDASAQEAPAFSGTPSDVFADGFANIGRWTNGTVTGPFYNINDGGPKPIGPNEAQHYALARVAPVFPASGSANYTLLAATKPLRADSTSAFGTVANGSLSVAFGGRNSTHVGMNLTLTMSDGTYTIVVNGGSAAVGDAGDIFFQADAAFGVSSPSVTATGCGGGACSSGGVRISYAGPNLERVIVAYVIGSGALNTAIRGAAVFARQ